MSSLVIGWETGALEPTRRAPHSGSAMKPSGVRRRFGLYALAIVLLASTLVGISAGPVLAHHTYPKVEVLGGGWGHGRGMGQYGALGYARDYGWTSRQILDHFYGGTTQGPAPTTSALDPDRLRVQLAAMNSKSTAMTLAVGRMVVMDGSGNRVRSVSEPALRFVARSGGFQLQVAQSCSGPWSDLVPLDGSAAGVKVELEPDDPADDGEIIGRDSQTLLGVCGSQRAWYDGEIWTHRTSYGQRTVNVVSVEQYLRGVVPNEVPASWPEAVLEAQAVAARSYVLAGDTRWGAHANTCDSTYCQVYDGRVTTRGGTRTSTHSRTDAAIVVTRDQVRLTASGRVARTEFSSSTGGHTTSGDFTAVEDLGDATSANPNASWTLTVGLSGLANRYGLGPVQSIGVTQRDGFGRFGGRATEVTIGFRDGTRTMTGSAVRRFFGLKSDLFDFGPIQLGPPAEPQPDPDPEPDPEEPALDLSTQKAIVEAMVRQLGGRAATEGEQTAWAQAMVEDEELARYDLAKQLVADEVFAGKLIDGLYQSTFKRVSDQDGRSHWIGRLTTSGRSGMTYEQIGTYFFGSAEYYRRSGGTDAEFVDSLYRDLLGRRGDSSGLEYWLQILDRETTEDVVTWFYRSEESRRDRAGALYRLATGQTPDATSISEGAQLLTQISDLELAARYGADIRP